MKIGDSIKSIKPGNLNGFIGNILNIDTEHKRVTAISKDSGTWRFGFNEIILLGKEEESKKILHASELPFEIEDKPIKRTYHKKVKSEPIKEKRKYQKKIKI